MELFKPISEFFAAIQTDYRIGKTHIAIYMSLIHHWQLNGQPSPIRAFSYDIMQLAKIEACSTYHRCLKDLHDFGYLRYEPSYKKNSPSAMYLILV